jgi:hypothetical protein
MFGQALIACGKDKKVLEKKYTCSVKPSWLVLVVFLAKDKKSLREKIILAGQALCWQYTLKKTKTNLKKR